MLTQLLPFPSMLLASRNDHRVSFERAKFFAENWGSQFVDVGALGHMDTELCPMAPGTNLARPVYRLPTKVRSVPLLRMPFAVVR